MSAASTPRVAADHAPSSRKQQSSSDVATTSLTSGSGVGVLGTPSSERIQCNLAERSSSTEASRSEENDENLSPLHPQASCRMKGAPVGQVCPVRISAVEREDAQSGQHPMGVLQTKERGCLSATPAIRSMAGKDSLSRSQPQKRQTPERNHHIGTSASASALVDVQPAPVSPQCVGPLQLTPDRGPLSTALAMGDIQLAPMSPQSAAPSRSARNSTTKPGFSPAVKLRTSVGGESLRAPPSMMGTPSAQVQANSMRLSSPGYHSSPAGSRVLYRTPLTGSPFQYESSPIAHWTDAGQSWTLSPQRPSVGMYGHTPEEGTADVSYIMGNSPPLAASKVLGLRPVLQL